MEFFDAPNLIIPAREAVFETYLAGVRADGSGEVLRDIEGVHFTWRYRQKTLTTGIAATIQGNPPGGDWGEATALGFISPSDFNAPRVTRLTVEGVLPPASPPTPTAADGDGDGLLDAWEARYGLSTASTVGDNGANGDPDGDGVPNVAELQLEPIRASRTSRFSGAHRFFLERIAVANPGNDPAEFRMDFLTEGALARRRRRR